MSECAECNGTGERIIECNTHDVLYKEPCYCLMWEERLKEELAIKIANVLADKLSKEIFSFNDEKLSNLISCEINCSTKKILINSRLISNFCIKNYFQFN